MKKSNILIICEGDKELNIISTLNEILCSTKIEIFTFETNVTKLLKDIIKEISIDEYENFDSKYYFREYFKNKYDKITLSKLDQDFTAKYLIFDREPHERDIDYNKFRVLINHIFNSEDDNGLLLVNYPTVESFFCFNDKLELVPKVSNKDYDKFKSKISNGYCNYRFPTINKQLTDLKHWYKYPNILKDILSKHAKAYCELLNIDLTNDRRNILEEQLKLIDIQEKNISEYMFIISTIFLIFNSDTFI